MAYEDIDFPLWKILFVVLYTVWDAELLERALFEASSFKNEKVEQMIEK